MYLIQIFGLDLIMIRFYIINPHAEMCVGFLASAASTLAQRVSEQTNSITRIYAGYNINPLSVDPAKNG